MNRTETFSRLESAIGSIPVIDIHTHLVGGRLGARGLHDILLYHMVISDLYAAGCPNGSRLTQYPGWPSLSESHQRLEEAIPFLPYIANTSSSWGVRIILKDLYGWDEPVTTQNWRELDALIRERADERAWHHEILDRAGIVRTGTEIARRGNGEDDARLQYALEWGFFTRCQWGEYDTALYELERCWGKTPGSPAPIGGGSRPRTDKVIKTLDDLHAAMEHYIANIPFDHVLATAMHISTDIDLRTVTDCEMSEALTRRGHAGPNERDVYASYICEQFLSSLERYGDRIVFQFSYGAEPLPFETSSRLSQRSIAQMAEVIGRHPGLHFQCMLASRHANQSICTLARELPNLSVIGFWWHNFFPDAIAQVMRERLEMLPRNKQIGFFSDAYCVEWSYAKLVIIRKILTRVLAEMVERGQYSEDLAVATARGILFESPRSLLRMSPKSS